MDDRHPPRLSPAAAVAGTPLPDAPHVVVQGEGLVSVAPDSATVSMVARHRSANAGDAKRVVDGAVAALLMVAPDFDVAPDGHHRLRPRPARGRGIRRQQPPTAHVASREVKVRLGDLERLGAWMDAALAAGFTDVFDVSFSQQVRLREHARVRAVADAREKAGGLAAAFGGRLGPVYSINSLNSMQTQGYGNTALDRIQVTGSRIDSGRYLQPKIDFTERASAVFEIAR